MSTSILMKCSTLIASAASLIGLASVFCASPSQAAILNGGFETGDFSNWSTVGNTSTQTSAYGSGPSEGKYDALLSTTEDAVNVASLEDFLGLSSASLNDIGNGITFQDQGSAIEQTFNATAGQVLTFNWDFLTNEGTPSQFFNDFSFVNISSSDNAISSLSKLADTTSTFVPSPTSNYGDTNERFASETGFKTFSYTIPTTGTYTLGIGAITVGDAYGISGVLVDNVALSTTSTAVPEPNSTPELLALGVLGMGVVLKRQQQNKA